MVHNRRDTFNSRGRRLLAEHIEAHWSSAGQFADELELSHHSISFLLSGRTRPSLERAVAIEKLTRKVGLPIVTCEDWVTN
ncbi:MAG: hypothetical protein JW841_10600 [Deltaproteobacteria bacterium]|nr:hypothetical protein [Deltaproteobacteria bacterium]